MASFEPDEPINSMKVVLHTADVFDADTDSDIFVELFDWPEEMAVPLPFPCAVEIDTDDYNDFERNDTRPYHLPKWYFKNRIINDIVRICLHKGDDGGSDWAFGWMSLEVNGKPLFSNMDPGNINKPTWLSDGQKWCGNWTRIPFVKPSIQTLGLRDAGANESYKVKFTAKGGRKPLKWEVTKSIGSAFTAKPGFTDTNTDGTETFFTAHTVQATTNLAWTGEIRVTDAEGRITLMTVSMRVIFSLPAPTLASLFPEFGWPGLAPAEPSPTTVLLTGKDFDSRKAGATRVFFRNPANTSSVEGKVLDMTSSKLKVEVPAGAGQGPLKVKTPFGEVDSAQSFTAHPNGYRFTSGFPFVNNHKKFPDTFAYERYEETFGITDMWLCDPITELPIVPNPVAHMFFVCTRGVISNGCCHGFSITSLQLNAGFLPTRVFAKQGTGEPVEDGLWDFQGPDKLSNGISNIIQSRQLVVFSDEAMSYFLDKIDDVPNVSGNLCEMDANPALASVKQALANKLLNPLILAFAKNCSPVDGHVVVPYSIEDDGKFKRIRCYDPNHPALTDDPNDENSFFTVNTANGSWSYKGKAEEWNGFYMFTIPLSEYGHQWDWSLPGIGTLTGTLGLLAGLATAEGGDIVQVTDASGRTLFDDAGGWNLARSQWPEGARPVPLFEPSRHKPKMVALTKPVPLTFTLRPRSGGAPTDPPAMLSILRGGDCSVAIEEATTTMNIRFDPSRNEVQLSPVAGKASAIVRFTQRFSDTSESLSYAVRLREISAERPALAEPGSDRRSITVSGNGNPMDIEVTHCDRHGEQRIFECDGLDVPADARATFQVPDTQALDKRGATPLAFDLQIGGATTRQMLGQRITGLQVVAPYRVLRLRPVISIGGATTVDMTIDVSRSRLSGTGVRLASLYGAGIEGHEGGKVRVSLPTGSRIVQLVAIDQTGRRSFPRTVFATVPAAGQPVVPVLKVFGERTLVAPGTTATLSIGAFLSEFPAARIVLDFSVRDRISGMGSKFPELLETFDLSPELTAVGASVKVTRALGGLTLHLELSWSPTKALSGRIGLGDLAVRIPGNFGFGHTFMLSGKGIAVSGSGTQTAQEPVQVLAPLIQIWGGGQPASVTIEGPAQVREDAEIMLEAVATDLPPDANNAGWWTNGITGRARALQSAPGSRKIQLKGQRAGLVRVSVVVGTVVAETIIRVTPNVQHPELRVKLPLRRRRRRGFAVVSPA